VTRQELETASEHLESAARASADADVSERLSRVAQKLTVWLAADSGPDHGQLARIENRLHSLRDDVDASLRDDITTAHELVREYRSGVEGV
jgi:hypothetical protein